MTEAFIAQLTEHDLTEVAVHHTLRQVLGYGDALYITVESPGSYLEHRSMANLLERFDEDGDEEKYHEISGRFLGIARALNIRLNIEPYLNVIRNVSETGYRDFVISRGSYLTALMVTKKLEHLGFTLVDSATFIKMDARGVIDRDATKLAWQQLRVTGKLVIPSTYGSNPDKSIHICNSRTVITALAELLASSGMYERVVIV